jgi:hypothetical protein
MKDIHHKGHKEHKGSPHDFPFVSFVSLCVLCGE